MDKDTRNAIERATQRARKLLEEDFTAQLEGDFDVHRSGAVAAKAGPHLSARQAFQRERIVAAIEHKRAAGMGAPEAVADYLRDAAFTTLNRFVALKMLEARELVQECITKGEQSSGYREFCGLAPGLPLLPDSAGYRLYIESLFDELSTEVKVLFNRRDVASLLWPKRACFEDILAALNVAELSGVWGEDETIGWVYQYYNDEAERKKMREESSAPRNSRELAVRNQFFTPRYVVEFLTDNTLGRLWYEMRRGDTSLRERCRYLVRRPTEIFLREGESAPESAAGSEAHAGENLSQEELLRQPVHIPHRPLKDPREIRLLDPACGSMHFGLYAFDLFTVIYDEAWEIAHGRDDAAKSAVTFAATFPDKAAFLREVPRLIVERNIHGIDIDPRAVQIAGLSLWLRAQRAWHQAGVKPADRPRITRSNLVCAEPMPGEKELLREFVEQQFPTGERSAFAFLLERIFDRMTLAGEAGSLLRIEEEIRAAIAEARTLAQTQSAPRQARLFPGDERPERAEFDLRGLNDEQFWQAAEQRIYDALEAYAQQAENGRGFQRRLFANDTAQGFAFIDLCRKRYDVAVMNPPFGDASLPSKSYIDETYGDTKGDVYKAFVECFHARLVPAGYLGIISSRTGFFLGQSEDWRMRVVLRLFRPIALADLGSGVLDAMVEVAAYVLRNLSEPEARDLTLSLVPVLENVVRDKQDRFSLPKWQAARGDLKRHQAVAELEHLEAEGFIQRCPGDIVRYTPLWHAVRKVTAPPAPVYPPLVCVRALASEDKGAVLSVAVADSTDEAVFVCDPGVFGSVPGSPFAYWTSNRVRRLFSDFDPFESDQRFVRVGLATADDFRFIRATWEVPPDARNSIWFPFVKGGAFSPFYADVNLLVHWARDGRELKAWTEVLPGCTHWSRRISSAEYYFNPGLTWPLRARAFSPQAMPAGCVFSVRGYAILAPPADLPSLLGFLASAPFDYLFKVMLGRFGYPEFVVGTLQQLPIPNLVGAERDRLANLARAAWKSKRSVDSQNSTSHAFILPAILAAPGATLTQRATAWTTYVRTVQETVSTIQAEIDDFAFRLYGLDAADRAILTETLVTELTAPEAEEDEREEAATGDVAALTIDLLAYALGCVFGRWDIRYATGERLAPALPDPFAPLPVCPPGMLQGDDGLPLSPEAGRRLRAEGRYPLDVVWDGILVDDPEHPLDLERRVHAALAVLYGDCADALEHEACALLGVPTLREWFRRPVGFFADHLKHYSKSRRQAPIYWPLSTVSGSYSVWLYYHRFSKDMLYKALEQVKQKVVHEEGKLARLTSEAEISPSAIQRKELAAQEQFVAEILAFHEELARVAPLWNSNLNDGAIINYGPLWRMIAHKPWQKAVKDCWLELVAGKYDWAHLAMHLWPERVVPKCATDRSLTIAHGLEDVFWQQVSGVRDQASGKWAPKPDTRHLIPDLVHERTSPAVKAALKSLLEAPVGGQVNGTRARRANRRSGAGRARGAT